MKTTLFCYQLLMPQYHRGPRAELGKFFKKVLQKLIDDNDAVKAARGPGVIELAARDVTVQMLREWCADQPLARDACIGGLYAFIPAARRDYHNLKLVTSDTVPNDDSNCLICHTDGSYCLLLRGYKTAHAYGDTKTNVPCELQALIEEHMNTSKPSTWLFEYIDRYGVLQPSKPEWMDAQLSRIYNPLFRSRGHDVRCNVGLLRKVWRTDLQQRTPGLARAMMHSETTASRWYDCNVTAAC